MSIKIGIIGRVAQGSDLCDGQTVKTRVLAEELTRRYPDCVLLTADTYNYKKHVFSLLLKIERCIRECDVIFILLSRNGRRFIFPIVHAINRFHRKPILHDVIGGAFEYDLVESRTLQKYCAGYAVNWIESKKAVERLRAAGFGNAAYLPNFKRLSPVAAPVPYASAESVCRFCTFSRVMREKGIGTAAQALSKTDIRIDDNSSITVAAINAKCRRLENLGLVVIDYLQLMTDSGYGGNRGDNRVNVVTEISRALKVMAKELDVPVICLSQLNRGPEGRQDKHPAMSDLRESGAIEQDADSVLLLYREDFYNPDTEKKNVAECNVAKNRHGKTGPIEMQWIPQFTTFSEKEWKHEG